jgi:hypothetical protein
MAGDSRQLPANGEKRGEMGRKWAETTEKRPEFGKKARFWCFGHGIAHVQR